MSSIRLSVPESNCFPTQFNVLPCTQGRASGPPILVSATSPKAAAEAVLKQHFDSSSTFGPARAMVSYTDEDGRQKCVIFRRSFVG